MRLAADRGYRGRVLSVEPLMFGLVSVAALVALPGVATASAADRTAAASNMGHLA